MWDIGGQAALRQYWENYYKDNDAIIFVIDSSDSNRIEEVKEVMGAVLEHANLANIPTLFLANKQDMETALEADEVSVKNLFVDRPYHVVSCAVQIKEQLNLDDITNRSWAIHATSATEGYGIEDGLLWLINTLKTLQT